MALLPNHAFAPALRLIVMWPARPTEHTNSNMIPSSLFVVYSSYWGGKNTDSAAAMALFKRQTPGVWYENS